jgi:hypothetical protein
LTKPGDFTQNPRPEVNERNRDISTAIRVLCRFGPAYGLASVITAHAGIERGLAGFAVARESGRGQFEKVLFFPQQRDFSAVQCSGATTVPECACGSATQGEWRSNCPSVRHVPWKC